MPKLKRWHAYAPAINGLPIGSTHHGGNQLFRFGVLGCAALVPAKCREPLYPQVGVTPYGVISRITSEGITPPSSLIQAHGPDLPAIASAQARRAGQNPPPAFGCPYCGWSLQVVASPCWEMALPNVISAILAWVLGPLPRGVPSVLLPVPSRKTSASR
ncbi:MAG: hypothetical protein JRJ79_17015 [Deltaproteobacteria bacterium]|nr:hypothetical protein [Deltaproteobacteria bacterium]